MRILHVVPTYLPAVRYGGPIFAVHGLARSLAERGHEVRVLTTTVDGPGTLEVPRGSDVALDGVHVRYFDAAIRRVYWSREMVSALSAAAGDADIVHSHAVFLWPGIAASRAARRTGVPYVISPRGMLVPELIRARSALAKQVWLNAFEKRAFAGAAAIHFTSEAERHDAARVGVPIPSALVIPNGVDVPERPAVPRDARTLLFLGRLSWKKGIERVIDLLPSLPGVRFVVAGNDEEGLTASLRDRARRLGVQDRLTLTGPVYGAEKVELLARATLFVLLSQSENFGNAVLEALAVETPVVLSPEVGLADDVVAAGAGITGPEGIAGLLGDPAKRAAMGRSGRALVAERFSWRTVAQRMEEAYASLIERRAR